LKLPILIALVSFELLIERETRETNGRSLQGKSDSQATSPALECPDF
jgi:hypothetical protein